MNVQRATHNAAIIECVRLRHPWRCSGTDGGRSGTLACAQEERPAFVVIERTATTGPESIQEEYGKLARDILPKYDARYLARSRRNTLLEGEAGAPCCMAILQFPSVDAAKR